MKQSKPRGVNLHKLEVQAFLAGATQLRIPVKPQPIFEDGIWYKPKLRSYPGLSAWKEVTTYKDGVAVETTKVNIDPPEIGLGIRPESAQRRTERLQQPISNATSSTDIIAR